MLVASRSRSASPRKRVASEVVKNTVEGAELAGSPDSGFESRGRPRKRLADPWDPDDENRGRPRKRP